MIEPYYKQNGITIYNADCRDVLPQLETFDLLLTDPPYGIGAGKMTLGSGNSHRHKKMREKKASWDDERPDIDFVLNCSKKKCIWGGNYFTDTLPPTNHWMIWHKQNDGRSFSECEVAWTDYGKQMRHFSKRVFESKVHPTQKPLPLMQWCIKQAGDGINTIFDPFMGSGTTLVAAKLEGKQAVGIELDESYCESAAKRLEQGVLFAAEV